ncbi:LCCL domain-containing protein [Plasmodium chabaudi adami]|uniref:LCCL domain-containing protein n=1 Tax=Plasmodium chabaudi adami TaxID=5826 RepID=A0A1D3LGJ5_PLACE|nr:LCCL domain-containing protein [Plasmodium chabaudi adami]
MSTYFFLTICFFVFAYMCECSTNDYTFKEIFLKHKGSYCLYPENAIDNSKFDIALDECDKIAHENERKISWFLSPEGKLRTKNGLCLKTNKNFLVVSICSPNNDEKSELWNIDHEKKLKNETNDCAQLAGNKIFSFKCNPLSTKEFEIVPFSLDELNLMKIRYTHNKLINVNTNTSVNKYDTIIDDYDQIKNKIDNILNTEKEMKNEKEKIINLINDIKSLINITSPLNNYGNGALMYIYDMNDIDNTKSLLQVPLDKLELDQAILNELGIENKNVKIIIHTFLSIPKNNYYTFVAKNVTGNLIVKLNGNNILYMQNAQHNETITSEVLYLPGNILLPLYIEIASTREEKAYNNSSEQKNISFSLFWSSKNIPEQIINSLYFYMTIFEKNCYKPYQKKIYCSTTFESIPIKNQPFHFLCPFGCLASDKTDQNSLYSTKSDTENPEQANKNGRCLNLKAKICESAVQSNFLSNETEGIVKIIVKSIQNESGNYEDCGILLPNDTYDNSFKGITDIKLVDMDDFFTNFNSNKDIYLGYKGIVTDDKHSLLTKRDLSKRYISDIDINCDNNIKNGYEFKSGSFVVKRIKSSDLKNEQTSIVIDTFALFDKYSTNNTDEKNSNIPINFPGWTRKVCKNIQLYIKYGKINTVMDYPSLLLSCDYTFENITLDNNQTIVARCLPNCFNQKNDIFGSYIYAPHSPICKSAIHSGIITNLGGLIEITKLTNITQSFSTTTDITRNGVKAIITDNKNKDSYYLTKPNGSICNYPTTYYNRNQPISLQKNNDLNKTSPTFIQLNSHTFKIPPVVLVNKNHAALQNQLYNMHNWYNTENYKKENKFIPSENGKEIPIQNKTKENETNIISPSSDTNTNLENEIKTFEQNYNKDQFKVLQKNNQNIFSNLFNKKNNINNFHKILKDIRIEQNNYDSFLKQVQADNFTLIKKFDIITAKKKYIIESLQKSLKNIKTMTVKTFEEIYDSENVNDNYYIMDNNDAEKNYTTNEVNNENMPSNWRIEKYTDGNYFSSITNDSIAKSNHHIYASYVLYKYIKLSRGFISLDVKIPYEGNFGIIFKYKDFNNYANFVINKNEMYFIELINGVQSEKINYQKINNSFRQLGNWTKIFIEFGNKNVRAYINKTFGAGYKSENNLYGLLGFGINNSKEKIFIDKLVIGSLDQAKYYKENAYDQDHNVNMEHGLQKKKLKGRTTIDEINGTKIGDINVISHNFNNDQININEPSSNEPLANSCRPYQEIFNAPLEYNWIIPLESFWRVQKNFDLIPFFGSNQNKSNYTKITNCDNLKSNEYNQSVNEECNKQLKNEENYLYGAQKNIEDNLVIPSIMLLKKDRICTNIGSYTFSSSISLKPFSKSGIVFRVLSSDNFLSVILDISDKTGKLYLLKISKGIPYQLNTTTHIPINQDTWYNLVLLYNGSNINIMLNDENVFKTQINESTINNNLGNLGLIVLSGESMFKNILFIPHKA